MNKTKQLNNSRGKYFSIVIQPKIESSRWKSIGDIAEEERDHVIHLALLNSGWPLWTEVEYNLQVLEGLSLKGHVCKPLDWAYGTETSEKTNIPHYQCFVEFEVLVRRKSLFDYLSNRLHGRCHIATEVAYSDGYRYYCTKNTSNFEFDSPIYWNIKRDSREISKKKGNFINLRPNLMDIKNNYFTGQRLLRRIAVGEPDDRTGIWLADVIGGTGKTGLFQTIVDDPEANGLYLKITDGLERLSAKLRKKIETRLKNGQGYPRFIWINFGRTIDESGLRTFADFGEQVLDGMLDDNFGNTGGGDFTPLPYVNLIVTANTPPNLKQLTGDRIKLMTLFPVYSDVDRMIVEDSLLIPIYVEIQVKLLKKFPNSFTYKYIVRLQGREEIAKSFGRFDWYDEMMENVMLFEAFQNTPEYKTDYYQSRLETEWIPGNPYTSQDDIKSVYLKALWHTATDDCAGTTNVYVTASSFKKKPCRVEFGGTQDKLIDKVDEALAERPQGNKPDYSKIRSMFPDVEE